MLINNLRSFKLLHQLVWNSYNKFMNKASLINRISEETGINRKQVATTVDTMLDVIMDELKKDNEVSLTGFGTFLTRTRHERGGVNPQNPKERINIPEVRVAKFKTGKTLKDTLKK